MGLGTSFDNPGQVIDGWHFFLSESLEGIPSKDNDKLAIHVFAWHSKDRAYYVCIVGTDTPFSYTAGCGGFPTEVIDLIRVTAAMPMEERQKEAELTMKQLVEFVTVAEKLGVS